LPVYNKNNISDKNILSILTQANNDINSWDINMNYINNTFWNNSESNYQFAKYLNNNQNLALLNEKGMYIFDYQSKIYLDSLSFDKKMNYSFYDFDVNSNSGDMAASANSNGENFLITWNYKNGEKKIIDAAKTPMLNETLKTIAFNKSGNILYTCSDNTIYKWDMASSKVSKFFTKNGAIFNLIRIHPDDEQIFVSGKNSIIIIRSSDMTVIDTLSFDGDVSAFDIDSNGSEVAAVISFSMTNYFTLIDLNTKKKSKILPLENEYSYSLYNKVKLKYTPDSKRIIINYASLVYLFDRIKNEMSGNIRSDFLYTNVDFVNDTTLVIPGNKGLLYFMDITKSQKRKVINAPGENTIAISNYPHSQYIATFEGTKPAINLYDYDGRFINSLNIYDMNGTLFNIIFHPQNESCFLNFVSSSNSYNYVRYNILNSDITEVNRGSKVFACSDDGKNYGIFNDKEIALYEDGNSIPYFKIPNKSGSNLLKNNLAFSPEGKMLAVVTKDKNIEVYNTLNGLILSTIKSFDYDYYNIKFIPGSSVLCFNGRTFSYMIKFYNPIDGKPLDSINYSRASDELIFNKTGTKMLIAGGSRSLYLYDIDFSKLGNLEDKISNVEVKEDNDNKSILINPTPARDYIDISGSIGARPNGNEVSPIEAKFIEIYNILGVVVAQTSSSVSYLSQTGASDPLRIDVSLLIPGIYFIKIGNRVEKFVKI
jgi:hypothetical protein